MTIPTEHAEQVSLINWFRLQYPNILIFAIPNGEYRDPRTASRLKAEGVTAGVPDLFIPEWRLWIEMKRSKGGSVSKEQKAMHEHLKLIGYQVIIGKGFADAKEKIEAFIKNKGEI
jgi:hypothetical protein